ncbi:hypothetical protein Q6330_26925, partial [Klebsiella pneumoniae]|uniref:hypothetical protein n=1 Tax=Klebsiella pneumoniae TaxID=573 RepID=UPI002730D8B9
NRVVNFALPDLPQARRDQLIGQMLDVRIVHAFPHSLRGEVAEQRTASATHRSSTQPDLMKPSIAEFTAPKNDNTRLQNLCGPLD